MSGYVLRGGDGLWQGIGDDSTAMGCLLLIVNADGGRYCFGTIDVSVPEVSGGSPIHFVGAILGDVKFMERVDPFARNTYSQGIDVKVTEDHFPLREMRRGGLLLQDINVDVYYHVTGHRMDLSQSILLLRGKLTEPAYNEKAGTVSFRVEDRRLEGEKRPFPPVVASQDLIVGLLDEHVGKPYPIVIGSVKKLPVLDISTGGFDDFLVMLDRHNEWPGTPAVISAIYDEDATGPPTEAVEAQATDSDDNPYVHVTTAAGTDSRDVTVDVEGHTPATPAEAIRYLLTFFGEGADIFDLPSLDKLNVKMPNVTMSMAFNKREQGGVLGIIRNRMSSLLPFTILQRGEKYSFEPLMWDRHVTKHLRSDVNIMRTTAGPVETRRSEIFNSFTVNYGRSHFRGETTGTVSSDWTTDKACEMSRLRYGKRSMQDVDAGDLADLLSARWLMNWLIETYSKMRVFVSYDCTMDVVDVQLWDTVSVADTYEGWDENRRGHPLFKVIGITRKTASTITLDLVSIDDYADVYGINKSAKEARTQAAIVVPIDMEACWWTFDNTPPLDYVEADGNYGGDFDPAGDFTVMTMFEEINEDINQYHGLAGKYLGTSKGGWRMGFIGPTAVSWPGGITFRIAKSWSHWTDLRLDTPGPVAVGRKVLVACTYNFIGDGSSIMRIVTHDVVNGKLSTQRVDAVGPVEANTRKMRFGNNETYTRTAGKVYWCGFYDGVVISDADILEVWNKTKHPIDDFNPTALNYYCQAVGATYNVDVGNGPNAPYVFDVIGTPVKGP